MRKIVYTLLFLLSLAIPSLKAQVWADFGIKGGMGMSFLMNSNIWNDRSTVHKLSPGSMYGARIGLNLGMKNELTVEANFTNYMQNMQVTNAAGIYNFAFGFNGFEIPVLYRLNSEEGSYLEVGSSFGKVKGAIESGDLNSVFDPLNNYEQKYNTAIFGFGSYVLGLENTYLSMGVRFSYTFTDIISETGGKNTINYYPTLGAYTPDPSYSSYKATNPFSALFVIEINHDLGYLSRANCGRTAILLF